MPAHWFRCPDNETIEIEKCLKNNGCRMNNRCSTRPFLRLIGYDREWKGVSPSSAGNGPRYLYLKIVKPFVVDPQQRVWAAFGTGTHDKLSIHKYTHDVLSEEPLRDTEMQGIADCLEASEEREGYYNLYDYKTWGSFKIAKALGIVSETKEEVILDENKKPVLLKSGPHKGKPKTKKVTERIIDISKIDLRSEEYQLNRYRIFFEQYGFPIDKQIIQAIPRDGGTYVAQGRGIDKNLYMIPIKKLPNNHVLDFYKTLSDEILKAFNDKYIRLCNIWESWERRRCTEKYCEVIGYCQEMSKLKGEKWGIL